MMDDLDYESYPQDDNLADFSNDELKQAGNKFWKKSKIWFFVGLGIMLMLEVTHKLFGWPANPNSEAPWVWGLVGLFILDSMRELAVTCYANVLIESRSRMQRIEARLRRIEREIGRVPRDLEDKDLG